MIIKTETFGDVTCTLRDTDVGYLKILRFEAGNQPSTTATFRAAKNGEGFLVVLDHKWKRADGSLSPGFRITKDDLARIHSFKRAAEATPGPSHPPTDKEPNAQIWD